MNEEEIRILTPHLGVEMARMVVALAALAASCADLARQVRELQAMPRAEEPAEGEGP